MSEPLSRICEYIQDKRHAGTLPRPTATGRSSLGGQPPFTSIGVKIEDGVLQEARFQTSGCGYLIAACAAAIELSIGRSPSDCLAIGPAAIEAHLGGLPEHRRFAAELATAALHDAARAALAIEPRSPDDLP